MEIEHASPNGDSAKYGSLGGIGGLSEQKKSIIID